jgi:dTMP kinase
MTTPTGASAPGRLITIEGVEGAGKSTQLARLATWLEGQGYRVKVTAEPDGTTLGRCLRDLLGTLPAVAPLAEALLFVASRAEHVERVIRPSLAAGLVVLCDRFTDSTLAYQGYGRGVSRDTLAELNQRATGGLAPNLTIVLDLDVADGLRRVDRRREQRGAVAADRFERLDLEFHERVRKGYWAIQAREPGRVALVDASRDEATVAAEVRALVATRLGLGTA